LEKKLSFGSNRVTKSVEGGKSYFELEESREKLKQLAKKIPDFK
jgi:hypothetical protein